MTTHHKSLKCTFAASALLLVSSAMQAQADETHARELLKSMSDYLAAQNSISFQYDSTLEMVTKDGQKLGFSSSGSADVSRPDKIRATRHGGFANVELNFDGKTVTVLDKDSNIYAQVEVPGTIDNLVAVLRDKYGRPLPAADILSAAPYDYLMEGVADVKDLGSGVVGGQECDHLAFRTEDIDWQIWIAQGAAPYPCKYVITSKKVDASPQYTIDIRAWKAEANGSSMDFAFKAPDGAKAASFESLKDIDDLPDQFAPKAQ